MTLAADWGVGEALLVTLYFFIFVIWIMLLFQVFIDIFRSHDMGGVAKTLWVVFVILFPFLGVLIYLIARGGKMAKHQMEAVQEQDAAARAYIRDAAGSGSPADELARLADLHAKGVIDDAEFARLKAKVVG